MKSRNSLSTKNVLILELSCFTRSDLEAIKSLGEKQKLLHRWFRSERKKESEKDLCIIYSGTHGLSPYAAYRIERHQDGGYHLLKHKTGKKIVEARSIKQIMAKLPDDFYYSMETFK
ncbi:MAG: hypothetical protein CMM44_04695 [Rhodospirillaceae bacterium]|nr:hypothetical protein [Rhodospirillaceae bacterium]